MARAKDKRFNFNIVANVKEGFGVPAIVDDLIAIGVPIFYTLAPTVVGLSGVPAMLLGAGVPYIAGKMLNLPSLCHAAIGVALTHLVYTKGGGLIQQLLSKPVWRFSETTAGGEWASNTQNSGTGTTAGQPTTASPVSGIGYITTETVSAGGEDILAYNPNEIERMAHSVQEPIGTSTINDFVRMAPNPTALAGVSWDDGDSDTGGW